MTTNPQRMPISKTSPLLLVCFCFFYYVHIGSKTLAVDQHLEPGRFFLANDAPNYFDHDFSTPGYLITPAGYFVMRPGESELYKDEKDREHLR